MKIVIFVMYVDVIIIINLMFCSISVLKKMYIYIFKNVYIDILNFLLIIFYDVKKGFIKKKWLCICWYYKVVGNFFLKKYIF